MRRLLPIMPLIILIGCMPDPLEVKNIPELPPKIVVSTQFVPNQSLVVMLTKSFGALQNTESENAEALVEQMAVTDAMVWVRVADSVDTLTNLGSGLYGGIAIPFEPEELYELEIKSESMGTVRAVTQVKPQINFERLKTELSFNGYDDTLLRVSYQISDPPGRNNYLLNVQRFRANNLAQNLINPRAFMKLMEDQTFDGTTFEESFLAFPPNFRRGDTVAISIANISNEYYQFLKMREDNRFSLVEFLGEPINYPTNVEGGLGYFNLFVPTVRIVILE